MKEGTVDLKKIKNEERVNMKCRAENNEKRSC